MMTAIQQASVSFQPEKVSVNLADRENPGLPPSSLIALLRKVGACFCLLFVVFLPVSLLRLPLEMLWASVKLLLSGFCCSSGVELFTFWCCA